MAVFVCSHKSITLITRYHVHLFPRAYLQDQPFSHLSFFYLQELSIKTTGKTALTTDLNLQVWPFQELSNLFFFLNVHCFFIYPFTLRKRTPDLRTRQRTAGKQRDCLPFICISSFPWLKWTASFVPQETWYSLHHPLNPSSDPKPTGRSPGLTFQRSFWKSSVLGNKIHPEMHWGVMRPSRVWDLNTPTRHWNVEILRPVRHARKSQGNEDMWGRLNLKPKAPLGCRRKVTRGKACLGDQLHVLSFSTPLPCFAMLF